MKQSIFYLDDEPLLLNLFVDMFGNEFEVRTSTSSVEARRMLKDCPADIIISDQNMPEIEGTMFLREAAEACPQSYRILLTGAVSFIEVVSEISTGIVQMFVPKPWTEQRMREVLERAVAHTEQHENN
jgi:DNA-binding NtrC family response regulator